MTIALSDVLTRGRPVFAKRPAVVAGVITRFPGSRANTSTDTKYKVISTEASKDGLGGRFVVEESSFYHKVENIYAWRFKYRYPAILRWLGFRSSMFVVDCINMDKTILVFNDKLDKVLFDNGFRSSLEFKSIVIDVIKASVAENEIQKLLGG